MFTKIILLALLVLTSFSSFAQSKAYLQKKSAQLATRSIFQDIIDGKLTKDVLYQDDDIIAFQDRAPQLPVHILIIPKRRIPTINDLTDDDGNLIGKMIIKAKDLAKQLGIAETGYRLVMNTNENAGQSVFHIHLHLLGGHKTGAMVEQTWRNGSSKPSTTYLKDLDSIKNRFKDFAKAIIENNMAKVLMNFTNNGVIVPSGLSAKKGMEEIKKYYLFQDQSAKAIVSKFDYEIEDIKPDLNTAIIRASVKLSDSNYNGNSTVMRKDLKQYYTAFFERQADNSWLISMMMWNDIL